MKKLTYLFISAVVLSGLSIPKIVVNANTIEDSKDRIRTNDQQIFSEEKIPSSSSIENVDSFSEESSTDTTTSNAKIPTKDSSALPGTTNTEEILDKQTASSVSKTQESSDTSQNATTFNEQRTTLNWTGKSGSIPVTLDSNGVLHIPSGEIENPQTIRSISGLDSAGIPVKKIEFEGPLKLIGSVNSLFAYSGISDFINFSQVDTSQVTNMSSMFRFSALTSLDLSHFDTRNVTNMSSMFGNLPSLSSINLSGWDTSKVTNISEMFINDSSLSSVDVSHFNTQNATSFIGMFSGCSSLTGLELSNFNTSKAIYLDRMFANCSSLTSLDLSHFDTSNVTSLTHMFQSCNSLKNLRVSNWNTSKVSSMRGVFAYCYNLTNLDLSDWELVSNNEYLDMIELFYRTPIRQLSLGSKTRLSQVHLLYLDGPPSNDKFTGLWQTKGTGTAEKPNGDWSGSTAELIARSATGIADTYVWQPTEMVDIVFPIEVGFYSKKQGNQQVIEPEKSYTIENKSSFPVEIKATKLTELSNPSGLQLLPAPDENNKKGLLLNLTEGNNMLGVLTNDLSTNPIKFNGLAGNSTTTLGFSGYYYGDIRSKQQVKYQLTLQAARQDVRRD